jgi:hypothetical protein
MTVSIGAAALVVTATVVPGNISVCFIRALCKSQQP